MLQTRLEKKKSREKTKTPLNDGLRSRPERKPIIVQYLYTALNYTKLWESEKVHIMIKIKLHGGNREVSINAMIDLGATEDSIDKAIT